MLYEDYELTPDRIAKVKQISLTEPVLKGALISEKGDVTVVNITVQLPEVDKTTEVQEVMSHINAMLERYQQNYPNVEFHKAGIIAMNYAFMTAAQEDSSTLVPTMLLVILVFLTIMLRSFLSVVATLIVIIGSVMATMGAFGMGWHVLEHRNGQRANTGYDARRCGLCACYHHDASIDAKWL